MINFSENDCKDKTLYTSKTAISSQKIEELVLDSNCKILVFDTIDSTNSHLKQLAETGISEKTVVIANHQTSGRGRLGRSFYSPSDSGIYMSILLKPDIELKDAVNVTTCAGVAVCLALEKLFKIKPQIKWVNDIFLNGKKICGILTEAVIDANTNKPKFVVLGIGCNIFSPKNEFPKEIADIAGFVAENEKSYGIDRNRVVAEILNVFFELYNELGSEKIHTLYKERMFLLGEKVLVLSGEGFEAQVLDVNSDFSLSLKLENGEIFNLNTGEISVRAL